MTKKEERERLRRLETAKAVRTKFCCDFWLSFTKFFRPWLHELTRRYKERGDFPIMAAWLLPSYYSSDEDREIAAFAGILIRDNDRVLDSVSEFRRMMGDSPYKWFVNRGFVSLSIGRMRGRRTGGINNMTVAAFFSRLYDNWGNRRLALTHILMDAVSKGSMLNKARLLRLVLGTKDGFGLGGWTTTPRETRCPLTGDVLDFLKTFCPEYRMIGGVDDAIRLFGFEKDTDFFYAALAYKELQGRNPNGCKRLATVFQKRYKESNVLQKRYWSGDRGILPEIDL